MKRSLVTLVGIVFTQKNFSRIKNAFLAFHADDEIPKGSLQPCGRLAAIGPDVPVELQRVIVSFVDIKKVQIIRSFGLLFVLQTHTQFYTLWEQLSAEFENESGEVYEWFRQQQKEEPMPGKNDTVKQLRLRLRITIM